MTDGKHPCKYVCTGYKFGSTRYICTLTNNTCSAQYYCDAVQLWKPTTNTSKCQNFTPKEEETKTDDMAADTKQQ